MKIRFLGTSHGVPMPTRFYQSILIETENGDSYLVDAGAPVMDLLIRLHYDLTRVKAAFITHHHSDHMIGLIDMINLPSWYYTEMGYKLYLPEQRSIDALHSFSNYLLPAGISEKISFHLVQEGPFFDDGNLKVTAVHTEHMVSSSNIAYGFVLEADGQKIYITGDLNGSLCDFPSELLSEPFDMVITECAHFPAENLIEKLKLVNAKKVAVIHVFTLDKYDVLKEYAKEAPFEMLFPDDGDVVSI